MQNNFIKLAITFCLIALGMSGLYAQTAYYKDIYVLFCTFAVN